MAVFTRLAVLGLLLSALAFGCNRPRPPVPEPEKPAEPPAEVKAPAGDARLQQSFAEATRAEAPAEWQRPPDTTLTGKSVGKLYTEVKAQWDSIRFTTPEGKRLDYRAVLDTEQGDIEITLRPDLAPNHVRSFVALARAGYYDGLVFERTIHEQFSERPDDALDAIQGGCPRGLGSIGMGSIGYWLKPEFSKDAVHEPGAVGASRGFEQDSASCCFYVTLNKPPAYLDGHYTIFGQVTKGLDTARKISALPVIQDDEFPDGDRPVKPVVIRKVTILCTEVDNPSVNAENKK